MIFGSYTQAFYFLKYKILTQHALRLHVCGDEKNNEQTFNQNKKKRTVKQYSLAWDEPRHLPMHKKMDKKCF